MATSYRWDSPEVESHPEEFTYELSEDPPAFPDVFLRVGDVALSSKRQLLCRHSGYFEAMFSGAFVESGKGSSPADPIDMHHVDVDAFEACLDLFEKDPARIKESDLPVDDLDALVDLWIALDMLQATEFLTTIELRVFPYLLSLDNVYNLLNMATQRGRHEFTERVLYPFMAFHSVTMPFNPKRVERDLKKDLLTLQRLREDWFSLPPFSLSPSHRENDDDEYSDAYVKLPPRPPSAGSLLDRLASVVRSPFDRFLLLIDPRFICPKDPVSGERYLQCRLQWADHRPQPRLSMYRFPSAWDGWTKMPAEEAGESPAVEDFGVAGGGERRFEAGTGRPFGRDELSPFFDSMDNLHNRADPALDVVQSYLFVSGGGLEQFCQGGTECDVHYDDRQVVDGVVERSRPGERLRTEYTGLRKQYVIQRDAQKFSLKSLRYNVEPFCMNDRRYKHALVHDDEFLYAIGGVGGRKCQDRELLLTTEKCPIDGDSGWRYCASMLSCEEWRTSPLTPHARSKTVRKNTEAPLEPYLPGHSAVLKDGLIYAMGPSRVLQRYCVATDAWTAIWVWRGSNGIDNFRTPSLAVHDSKLIFENSEEYLDLDEMELKNLKLRPVMTTEMNGNLLLATLKKFGWNDFDLDILVMDEELKEKEVFPLRHGPTRCSSFLMFPVYATTLAKDYNPLPRC